MMNNFGAGFVLTATDQASPVMNAFSQNIGSLKERLVGVGAAAIAMGQKLSGAGAAMRAAFGAAMDAQGEFGAKTREVYTIADQSQFSLERIQKTVNELSKEFGSPAPMVAKAMYQTFSSGIMDATQAIDALRTANKLAVGGATDVETALDGLTSVMNAFSAEAVTATQVSDDMFIAIKAGKTTAEELSSYLGRVSPTAASLGVKFKELAGAIATITIQGISTASASAGLAAALSNVQKPSADAKDEAKRLGIEFSAAAMRAKGLQGFINDITQSANYNADSMSKLFGSIEAFKVMTALAANGGQKFNTIMKDMQNSAGSTEAAFQIMEESYGRMIEKNDAVVESIKRTFGADIQDLLTPFVQIIGKITKGFDDLTAAIPPEARKAILAFLAGFATLIGSVGGIIVLVGAMNLFGITLKSVVYSAVAFTAAIIPLTILLAGFGVAAFAMFKGFDQNVKGVGDTWQETMRKLKLGWEATIEMISTGGLSDAMQTELNKTENQGVRDFVTTIERLLDRLRSFWEGLKVGFSEALKAMGPEFDSLKQSLQGFFNMFAGDNTPQKLEEWRDAGGRAGGALARLGTIGIQAFKTLLPYVERFFTWLSSITADDIEKGITDLTSAFTGMVEALKVVSTVMGFLVDVAKAIWYFFMGIATAIGDFMRNANDLARFALQPAVAWMLPEEQQKQAEVNRQNAYDRMNWSQTEDSWAKFGNVFGGDFNTGHEAALEKSIRGNTAFSQEGTIALGMEKLQPYMEWFQNASRQDYGNISDISPYAKSFEESSRSFQQQQVNTFNKMADAINTLAKKELVAKVDIETLRSSVAKSEQLAAGRETLPEATDTF